MKSHLIVIPADKGKDEEQWLSHRVNGLGASDIGTVFGYNQWKPAIALWYEKLNVNLARREANKFMRMGIYDEGKNADLWQYWEVDEDRMWQNYDCCRIVRKCRKINAYVSNPKYPHLFVSLDRIINKGEKGEEGCLELKNISSWEADKWIAGIPNSYLLQLNTQMLVTEMTYGELSVITDGVHFMVWPFEANTTIAAAIVEKTTAFWDSIVTARKYYTQKFEAELAFNMRLSNELQAEIDRLEPPPDGTEAYEAYMKDKYKKSIAEIGLIIGTGAQYQVAVKLKGIREQIKKMEENARLCQNELMRAIGSGNTLDFGKDGRVSWKGEPRRFYNQVK